MKDLHGVKQPYIITDMLEILQLNNFVIAKAVTIDFTSGMSVITGETGAGKSLIVKVVGFVVWATRFGTVDSP